MVTIEDKMNAIAMADSEDPSDMAEKLEDFNDHLEDVDPSIKKSPQQMIFMFLNKLPKSLYLTFKEEIINKEMKDLTFEDVVDKATDHYERNIEEGDKGVKKVFNTHTSGGGGGDRKPKFKGKCRIPWCQKPGHMAKDCFLNPKCPNCKQELMRKAKKEYYDKKNNQSKPNDKEVICYKCGQKGHKSFQCATGQSESNQVSSLLTGATVVEVEEEEPTQKDSVSLFGKEEWDKDRESKDEFNNMFEEEPVIEEQYSVEANGVDAGAAEELKSGSEKTPLSSAF